MKKIQHNENLIQYEFIEVLDRVSYNTSVYALVSNGKVLLIDSGYYDYASEIALDLKKDGLVVDYVVITHYHRDHAEGSIFFDEANIVASHNYKVNLKKCQNLLKVDKLYKTPNIVVNGTYEFEFEEHNIKVIETPGHTPCGLSVIVDDKYLYVSDLILEDIDGKMIIPYIDLNSDPHNHLDCLNLYKTLAFDSILFTHGRPKFDLDVEGINQILEERINYLRIFIDSNYSADLQDCLVKPIENYAMTEIHKLNVRNAKKYVSKLM